MHQPLFAKVKIQDGQVYSSQFDDIYYNSDDGIAESRYVFLQANELPESWQQRDHYCIAETGFGTGLNFLVTLKAWLDDPGRCGTLDYFAIEGYPLDATQLAEIHAHWPLLTACSDALISQYPVISNGLHTLSFEHSRVQLHLIFGDVAHALQEVPFQADCWFLDGFAPSKNTSMWTADVLQNIARHARTGTHLATFTAAGVVRRNLIAAGFEVQKRKGYGRKREMLCATLSPAGSNAHTPVDTRHPAPWFKLKQIDVRPGHVAVIGAGIAGAQLAWHLAQRGMKVRVFESQQHFASGASGNPAGILAPKLMAEPGAEESFYVSAFLYQLRQIYTLKNQGHKIDFEQHGLLKIAYNAAQQKRLSNLAKRHDLPAELLDIMSAQQLSEHLGETVLHPGLFIESAGSLAPASLCKALLTHPGIELETSSRVRQIIVHRHQPGIRLNTQELYFDAVILANGYQATEFSDAIRITPVRGQTTGVQLPSGSKLDHAIDHAGYVAGCPSDATRLIIGASHERGECKTDLRKHETQSNFKMLQQYCPELASRLSNIKGSHAGVRASTPDRWPIIGPLPDSEFYHQAYPDLHLGKHYQRYPDARYHPGVYLLSGLGSRGLCSAAYCANILSHIVAGSSPPIPEKFLQAMHPARFMIRSIKRR